MKIVLLSTSEQTGGAAVATRRLMEALGKSNVEVSMLVRDRASEDERVVSVNRSFISRKRNMLRFIWERGIIFCCNRFSRKHLFQVSIANTGTDISRHPLVQQADVIHLHWINQGFLSLTDLRKLVATGKPVVWTLHDLWPATAICHYPDTCGKYQTQCLRCPMQHPHPLFDLANAVFKRKGKIGLPRITFVGCSQWIVREAQKSRWLKEARFASIPNPIDISRYHPMDKQAARRRFGLPLDAPLLLFAAAKLSETRKGAAFLVEACKRLKKTGRFPRLEIVFLGNSSSELIREIPFPTHALGYLSDPASLCAAYACADLFVIPSLEDNLPNTIMESMACGTPCVGFDTGGIPEMIDHLENGYVVRYKDTQDLANGIQWVLEHTPSHQLGEAAIRKVHTHYQESVIAQRYISLYQRLSP